jgi:hypothetical protein
VPQRGSKQDEMTNLPAGIGSSHFGRAASISAIYRARAARLAWIAMTRLRALAAASVVRPFMGISAVTPAGIGSGPPMPRAWSGAGPCREATFAAIAGRPSPEAAAVDSAAAVAPTTAEAMTAGALCWGGLVARCRPAGRL